MRDIAYKMQQNRQQVRRIESENRWRQTRQRNLMTKQATKIEQQLQCIKTDSEPDPFQDLVVSFKRLEASDCLTEWEPGSLIKLLDSINRRTTVVGLELLSMALKFAGQDAIMELIQRRQLFEMIQLWLSDGSYCVSAVNCLKQIALKQQHFRNYILTKGMLQAVENTSNATQFYEAVVSWPMDDSVTVQELIHKMINTLKKQTDQHVLKAINNIISWNKPQYINKLYELRYPQLLLSLSQTTEQPLSCITWCWAYLIDWQPETPNFLKDNLHSFIELFKKMLKTRSASKEHQANQNRVLFIIEQLFSDVALSQQLSQQIEYGLIQQLIQVLNNPINTESTQHVLRSLNNMLHCTEITLKLAEVDQIVDEMLKRMKNYVLQQPQNLKMYLQIVETLMDEGYIRRQCQQLCGALRRMGQIEGELGAMAKEIQSKV